MKGATFEAAAIAAINVYCFLQFRLPLHYNQETRPSFHATLQSAFFLQNETDGQAANCAQIKRGKTFYLCHFFFLGGVKILLRQVIKI